MVTDYCGVEPEVISGDEEAALSFRGADRGRRPQPVPAARYLVVDIGGGSTEFVLRHRRTVEAAAVGRHRLRAA